MFHATPLRRAVEELMPNALDSNSLQKTDCWRDWSRSGLENHAEHSRFGVGVVGICEMPIEIGQHVERGMVLQSVGKDIMQRRTESNS